VDSTFAVQEHLQDTLRRDAAAMDAVLTAPEGQDERVWQYEHVRYNAHPSRTRTRPHADAHSAMYRQFVLELGFLLADLYPVCTQEAHPFLKIAPDDQQEYLCAAHTPHKRVRAAPGPE
jgi:hypothetical protein